MRLLMLTAAVIEDRRPRLQKWLQYRTVILRHEQTLLMTQHTVVRCSDAVLVLYDVTDLPPFPGGTPSDRVVPLAQDMCRGPVLPVIETCFDRDLPSACRAKLRSEASRV